MRIETIFKLNYCFCFIIYFISNCTHWGLKHARLTHTSPSVLLNSLYLIALIEDWNLLPGRKAWAPPSPFISNCTHWGLKLITLPDRSSQRPVCFISNCTHWGLKLNSIAYAMATQGTLYLIALIEDWNFQISHVSYVLIINFISNCTHWGLKPQPHVKKT